MPARFWLRFTRTFAKSCSFWLLGGGRSPPHRVLPPATLPEVNWDFRPSAGSVAHKTLFDEPDFTLFLSLSVLAKALLKWYGFWRTRARPDYQRVAQLAAQDEAGTAPSNGASSVSNLTRPVNSPAPAARFTAFRRAVSNHGINEEVFDSLCF